MWHSVALLILSYISVKSFLSLENVVRRSSKQWFISDWCMMTYSLFISINWNCAGIKRNCSKNQTLLGGLEPPAFRLTAERANQLRHKSCTTIILFITLPFPGFSSVFLKLIDLSEIPYKQLLKLRSGWIRWVLYLLI